MNQERQALVNRLQEIDSKMYANGDQIIDPNFV